MKNVKVNLYQEWDYDKEFPTTLIYDLSDMAKWYIQIRGFRTILIFGKGENQVIGEGQGGGSWVSSIAREAENKFIEELGIDEYQKIMGLEIKNDNGVSQSPTPEKIQQLINPD